MTTVIRTWPDADFYLSSAGTTNVREQLIKLQSIGKQVRALSDASTVDTNGDKLQDRLLGLSFGDQNQRHKWRVLYDNVSDRFLVQRNTGTDAAKVFAERFRLDASGNVTTTGTLTAASSVSLGGALTLGGTLDANRFYIRNVDKMYVLNSVELGNGGRLSFDQNSSFRLTSNDVLALRLGGFDAVSFDGDAANPVNGFIMRSSATGVAPVLGTTGSDTDVGLDFATKGAGRVTVNGAGVFNPTRGATATTQDISAATETDITSLTALTLPTTTSVNTKTFEVSFTINVVETSGSNNLVTIRLYNGANGTKADTLVYATSSTLLASALNQGICVSSVTFTPGASNRTKFGLAVISSAICRIQGVAPVISNVKVVEVAA